MRRGMRELLGADEIGILARQPDREPARFVDECDEFFVDRARQHHLDDLDRRLIGDAQPVDERALDLQPLQHVADLRSAAMDDDRVHPDLLQQHDVVGELPCDRIVAHGVAAIFDDDGLAGIAPEIG